VSRRLHRVNEAVREVVSQAIETDIKDPRLGFVTVTGVDTTADLRDARVYITVLGDEAQRGDSLRALQASHGVLQGAVAARVRLKRTPRLEFVYDETTDRALHINELLVAEAAEIAARSGELSTGAEPEPSREGSTSRARTDSESTATQRGPAGGAEQGTEGAA
jgi:ribosome-binding factor A